MDLHLAGKTAAVSGASQGIGLATVELLASEGVRVVGAARTITPELDAVATSTLAVDLATADGPAQFAEHALAVLGGVDILVNNVGGAQRFLEIPEITDAEWQHSFDWNFFSAVRLTQALLDSLTERGASVINISSNAAKMPIGPPPYMCAKAALNAWSKALAEYLGPKGVRVNTISAGMTRTRTWTGPEGAGAQVSEMTGIDQEEYIRNVAPKQFGILTGRMVEPREVAAQVAWLASDRAANICGADVTIDGGMIKTV